MYDIFFIGEKSSQWEKLKSKFSTAKQVNTFEEAQKKVLTKMFWVVWPDLEIAEDFDFSYECDKWNQEYIHVFKNRDTYDGIVLFPKRTSVNKRELEYRFFQNKKEIDIVASNPVPYDTFFIDSWEEYETALENSSSEMFWALSRNLTYDKSFIENFYFSYHNGYDRRENHAFVHLVNEEKLYNGVFLCSKNKPLSKKEIEYRFLVNCKQWEDIVSGPIKYDIYNIDIYKEYLDAFKNSNTEMFWIIPSSVTVLEDFKFNLYFSHDNQYDRKINHVFKNGIHHDGITLCSKHSLISEREFNYKFFQNKKEVDVVASNPKPYDIVFISYQEPNADENYTKLLTKVPSAKRVHGVKGIHQAHIEAAKLCTTDMFWIVDGDAVIVDDFNFDYQVPAWEKDTVHVWRSQNPVNDLVYGYGGVKLFPRKLTLDMDISKPDMTTSISSKFKAVKTISNITAFNTDPFNTWKSAFRECCKLSSKVIDRQKDDETNKRLQTWCTVGENKLYGKYAITGAKLGAAYGARNQENLEALKKINDFDWLKEQFDASNF